MILMITSSSVTQFPLVQLCGTNSSRKSKKIIFAKCLSICLFFIKMRNDKNLKSILDDAKNRMNMNIKMTMMTMVMNMMTVMMMRKCWFSLESWRWLAADGRRCPTPRRLIIIIIIIILIVMMTSSSFLLFLEELVPLSLTRRNCVIHRWWRNHYPLRKWKRQPHPHLPHHHHYHYHHHHHLKRMRTRYGTGSNHAEMMTSVILTTI